MGWGNLMALKVIRLYLNKMWYSVRSQARFREFVHTLGRVVAKPTHQRVCAVAASRYKQTQNP